MATKQRICMQSVALGALGIHFPLKESNHYLGHNIITPPADMYILMLLAALGVLQPTCLGCIPRITATQRPTYSHPIRLDSITPLEMSWTYDEITEPRKEAARTEAQSTID